MVKEPVVFGWSGGRDSALALQEILRAGRYEVVALLTTCTEGFRRISMHGVRCSLLKTQASELGIPLRKVFIEKGSSNAETSLFLPTYYRIQNQSPRVTIMKSKRRLKGNE